LNYCSEGTVIFYLFAGFDERFRQALRFGMRRHLVTRAGIRAAIAFVAVYALLFNALLSASTRVVPSLLADAIICMHDGAASDQPAPQSPLHDDLCCIAVCGTSVATLAPIDYSRISLPRASTFVPAQWSLALFAPSPPPNAQASSRGPPSLI
jgi:hypothetical protein